MEWETEQMSYQDLVPAIARVRVRQLRTKNLGLNMIRVRLNLKWADQELMRNSGWHPQSPSPLSAITNKKRSHEPRTLDHSLKHNNNDEDKEEDNYLSLSTIKIDILVSLTTALIWVSDLTAIFGRSIGWKGSRLMVIVVVLLRVVLCRLMVIHGRTIDTHIGRSLQNFTIWHLKTVTLHSIKFLIN